MSISQQSSPLYRPSTNNEIARAGFNEFTELLKYFPPAVVRLFTGAAPEPPHYFKFLDVRRCVVGISAEITFEMYMVDAFGQTTFTQAEELINDQAQHFLFYRREKDPRFYHLFNLLAVGHVARNYPEYFPEEAATNTRAWLQSNWQIWADGQGENCIRYGLLSGFPLEAVLGFAADKSLKEKMLARSAKTNLSYFGVNPEQDREYMNQLDAIYLEYW